MKRWILAACFAARVLSAASPADWVPVRWPFTDPATLALVEGTKFNCIVTETPSPALVKAATQRGIDVVALIHSAAEVAPAQAAGVVGFVSEGVSSFSTTLPVILITSRVKLDLTSKAPVIGTYQGIWAGIQITEEGSAKAAPSGAPWIDTNTGFLRYVRAAWNGPSFWLTNQPPKNSVIPVTRYLQMIADAAMSNARWVISLDSDFAGRLNRGDRKARVDWDRITGLVAFYENHSEWRTLLPAGKLAVIESKSDGALLTGGVLDMIAAKHTPVKPVPPDKLTPESLAGEQMALDVAPSKQTADTLQRFTARGGFVLKGPQSPALSSSDGVSIRQDEKELKKLNDLWHDIQTAIGRRNLGVRLFNVSSMLSNLLSTPDRKQVYVELVNYSDYPVDNVTVHLLGSFSKATLFTPDGKTQSLEIYKTDEGSGVDIDTVGTAATVKLEANGAPEP